MHFSVPTIFLLALKNQSLLNKKYCGMKEDFEQILYYTTKAPSGHNTQPWKFKADEADKILILPDFDRALPAVDSDNHALFISLGCAAENMVIAAEQYGYVTDVQLHTDQQGYIEVGLKKVQKSNDHHLFKQLEVRQSTRNMYNAKPIPQDNLVLLRNAAEQDDVEFRILTNAEDIESIIELAKEGNMRQFENPLFVNELKHWIRFNDRIALEKNDGLAAAVTGQPNVPEWLGKIIMKVIVTGNTEAKKCEDMIRSSSGLVVFIGQHDDIKSWVNVGRSFERFALSATALGIHHAHVNMPCEERSVREKLASFLQLPSPEQQPLLLLRIGYSEKMPYSYRRPIEEVLVERKEAGLNI
jgi:Nitroreductase family